MGAQVVPNNLYESLQSRPGGLSDAEAAERLRIHGFNEIKSRQRFRLLRLIVVQFANMFLVLLLFASVVSWLTGARTDALIIVIIVLVNATISFIQEYRAAQSLKSLQQMLAPVTLVMRDGVLQKVPARLIVPGDMLRVEAGDHIPADGMVVESINGMVNESSLTGESVPISKLAVDVSGKVSDEQNAWAGTTVSYGRLTIVVTHTGMRTRIGNIARLTTEVTAEKSPLQEELDSIGRRIAKIAALICVAVFFILMVRHRFSPVAFRDAFLFAIALAVAIVPEGLPATVTIGLALGMRKLAHQGAIMRKLSAVETLGCTTVICTDKTGTLTQNEMTVRSVYTWEGLLEIDITPVRKEAKLTDATGSPSEASQMSLTELFTLAVLCNNAEVAQGTAVGDPTEIALLVAADRIGLNRAHLHNDWIRIEERPFDSDRRMMTTIHRRMHKSEETIMVATKGAPDRVLERCSFWRDQVETHPLDETTRQRLLSVRAQMAAHGFRVLAIACKNLDVDTTRQTQSLEENMIFVGLIGMADPPRTGVKEALHLCQKAGIRVIMTTGDQRETALAIARETGIVSNGQDRVITGSELSLMDDVELTEALDSVRVFAQIAPEDKLRIVEGLKRAGEIVAMTGDGINDAPALKRADIGVAMGRAGTDIAKEAAKMVIVDDSFATIVAAVMEGRAIYDNIRKFILYTFSGITAEFLVVCVSLLPGVGQLLTAIQILWIDLGTEVLPALALSLDPPAADLMSRKPRKRQEHLIGRPLLMQVAFNSIVIAFGAIALYLGFSYVGSAAKALTLPFVTIIIFQMANIFNCRQPRVTIFKTSLTSNPYLLGAVGISVTATVFLVSLPFTSRLFRLEPLSVIDWAIASVVACSIIVLNEVKKYLQSGI